MSCNFNDNKKASACVFAVEALINLAKKDDKIIVLTADVAHSTEVIRFKEVFPDRFINVGIAEQNLIAVASGLARVGFKPYVALFSSFASKRALDFIFADVCYPDLPITILATHGGTSFGEAGPTHHALCDITIIKSLPNIKVIVPADAKQAEKVIINTKDYNHPLYVRLNRGCDYLLEKESEFEMNKADILKEGKDGYILANGSCVHESVMASKTLLESGLDYGVINVHTLPDIDVNCIKKAAKTGKIITVEEGRTYGLGSSVATVLAKMGIAVSFEMLGIDGISPIGSHEELIKTNGVGRDKIVEVAKRL